MRLTGFESRVLRQKIRDLFRSLFYLIGNINLNWGIKNTHKMGMGNFKESAGMLKNTLCMCRGIIRLKSNPYLKANHHSLP